MMLPFPRWLNSSRKSPKRPTSQTPTSRRLHRRIEQLESRAMLNGTDPTAYDDVAITTFENAVDTYVLSNDFVNAPLASIDYNSVAIQSNPSNGMVTDYGSGMISYTPNQGFSGSDSFTYTFLDSLGDVSNVATVQVTVLAANPPVAYDDTADTPMGQAVGINILSNDDSVYSGLDPSTITVVSSVSNGSLGINSQTGQVTYTPNAGFSGSDSFQYTVRDYDGGESNVAVVSIQVVNSAPSVTMTATHVDGDTWAISGTATDELPSVTVRFGGLLTGHADVQADSNGQFSFEATLPGATSGSMVSGQAEDAGTLLSDVYEVFL